MEGNKIPRHKQHAAVAKTKERMSSQKCPCCFWLIRLVRARRTVDGKSKLVRVHGAIECINPNCLSNKYGYSYRGRDCNAASNIALAGYTQLVSHKRETLPPFSTTLRSTSHPPPTTSDTSTGNHPFPKAQERFPEELDSRPTYVSCLRSN